MEFGQVAERARQRAFVQRGYDAISVAYRSDDGDAAAASAEDVSRYSDWVAELAGLLRPGARVVDLGCGAGIPATRKLASHGLQVLGVDFSAVQLHRAQRLVPAARFAQADMAALQLRPASADAVAAFYSLIHVPLSDQQALFPRIRDWLRPGGYFLAIVGAGRWTGTDDSQEVPARAKPAADTREQGLLVRERNMDQGVEGHHGVCARRPQVQRGHVCLHEAGRGDKALSPAKLDGGEIDPEHLQPVAGQLAGCRYPGPAAEVHNPGSGPQQASQFRRPAGVAADVLCGGGGRIAVITAVGQRNRVITAADKGTLPRPLSYLTGFHHGYLFPSPRTIATIGADGPF